MSKSTVAFIHEHEHRNPDDLDFMNEHYKLNPEPPSTQARVGEMTGDQLAYIMREVLKEFSPQSAPSKSKTVDPVNEHKNPVSSVLNVVGNTLHGTVDIAEGLVRGVVDVVTFGRARR